MPSRGNFHVAVEIARPSVGAGGGGPRCRWNHAGRLQHHRRPARRSGRPRRGRARGPVPAGARRPRRGRPLRRLPDLPQRHPGCVHLRRPVRQRRAVRGRQGGRLLQHRRRLVGPAGRGAELLPGLFLHHARRPWRPSARRAASSSAPASISPSPTSAPRAQISTSTLQKPVIVFVYGQQGLFAGVNVAGQKITERTSR